jgi:hypothetical protein
MTYDEFLGARSLYKQHCLLPICDMVRSSANAHCFTCEVFEAIPKDRFKGMHASIACRATLTFPALDDEMAAADDMSVDDDSLVEVLARFDLGDLSFFDGMDKMDLVRRLTLRFRRLPHTYPYEVGRIERSRTLRRFPIVPAHQARYVQRVAKQRLAVYSHFMRVRNMLRPRQESIFHLRLLVIFSRVLVGDSRAQYLDLFLIQYEQAVKCVDELMSFGCQYSDEIEAGLDAVSKMLHGCYAALQRVEEDCMALFMDRELGF